MQRNDRNESIDRVEENVGLTFGSEVLCFLAGGGLHAAAVSMESSTMTAAAAATATAAATFVLRVGPGTAATLVCSGLAAEPAAVADAGLGGGQGAAALVAGGPAPPACVTGKPVLELGG